MNSILKEQVRRHVPAGEPSTTQDATNHRTNQEPDYSAQCTHDASPLLNQIVADLHNTVGSLESLAVSLEKRLSRVLSPQPPAPVPNGTATNGDRDNTYAAEVQAIIKRIDSIYGRIDSVLERLHV